MRPSQHDQKQLRGFPAQDGLSRGLRFVEAADSGGVWGFEDGLRVFFYFGGDRLHRVYE